MPLLPSPSSALPRFGGWFVISLWGLTFAAVVACFWKRWKRENLNDIERQCPRLHNPGDEIQSGDLYLSRWMGNCDGLSESIYRTIVGSGWSHVGIFHRDPSCGKLYILEFMGTGIQYTHIENRMYYYPGHLAVRRLRRPLNASQLQLLQSIVDMLLHKQQYNHPGKSIMLSSFRKSATRTVHKDALLPLERMMNQEAPGGNIKLFAQACVLGTDDESPVCTDFLRVILQRLGLMHIQSFDSCTKPYFFVSEPELDINYLPPNLIKNFDTEQDPAFDYCQSDGTWKVMLHPIPAEEAEPHALK